MGVFLDKEVNLHPILGFLLVEIIIEEELAASGFELLCHYVFHQHSLVDLQLVKHQFLVDFIGDENTGAESQ